MTLITIEEAQSKIAELNKSLRELHCPAMPRCVRDSLEKARRELEKTNSTFSQWCDSRGQV